MRPAALLHTLPACAGRRWRSGTYAHRLGVMWVVREKGNVEDSAKEEDKLCVVCMEYVAEEKDHDDRF